MKGNSAYLQVLVQLYLRGWNRVRLSEETQIPYRSLLRKLDGKSSLSLSEAKRIQKALDCGLSLDVLFAESSNPFDDQKGE